MKDIKLTRELYRVREMHLTSSMLVQEVTFNPARSTYTESGIPVLFLTTYNVDSDKATRYFLISVFNIMNIMEWLDEILGWFYQEESKLWFPINSSGEMYFNRDYDNVSLQTYQPTPTSPLLKAYPALVKPATFATGERGVMIIINNHHNAFYLTLGELRSLHSLMYSFSFQNEGSLLLNRLIHAGMSGMIVKEEGFSNPADRFKKIT